ncbi:MAG TPA: class I SAM-dependent methyltransferase [Kofleriaceae bacterium]
MSEPERFLREFHAARPGITARAWERGGSYDRLARLLPARTLDLACGNGPLLRRLGPSSVGVDFSLAEATLAGAICGRAQALPFRAGAFDAVACHLAFMLFDELERVVAEIDRVLAPGGAFLAVLGGGPTADGYDAHHELLDALPPRAIPRLGDPRARTEAGWRALFAGWDLAPFERWELDFSGDAWGFLSAAYEAPPEPVPLTQTACRAVVFLARATKPR